MVYLRATQKVLRRLPPKALDGDPFDTSLGDWFVNRLVVDRQPLLILVSGLSLLPILEPARNLRTLPDRLPSIVESRLVRLGVDRNLIIPAIEAMREVRVCATNNRSIVGSMIEFAKMAPYYLPDASTWDADVLPFAEGMLEHTPCRCSGRDTIWPDLEAPALLAARWS